MALIGHTVYFKRNHIAQRTDWPVCVWSSPGSNWLVCIWSSSNSDWCLTVSIPLALIGLVCVSPIPWLWLAGLCLAPPLSRCTMGFHLRGMSSNPSQLSRSLTQGSQLPSHVTPTTGVPTMSLHTPQSPSRYVRPSRPSVRPQITDPLPPRSDGPRTVAHPPAGSLAGTVECCYDRAFRRWQAPSQSAPGVLEPRGCEKAIPWNPADGKGRC